MNPVSHIRPGFLIATAAVLAIAMVDQAIDLNRSGREEVLGQFHALQSLLVRQQVHEAESFLAGRAADLKSVAALASVQHHDPAHISADLQARFPDGNRSRRAGIQVVDERGLVCYSDGALVSYTNLVDYQLLEWAAAPANRGEVYLLSRGNPADAGGPPPPSHEIFLATPLQRPALEPALPGAEPRWAGVVFMAVSLEAILAEHLNLLTPRSPSHRAWIMDQDGTIVLQSEHPEMTRENIFRVRSECFQCHVSFDYARDMLALKRGITEYQLRDQSKKLAAFAPLRFANASWVLVVNAPYSAVTSFVRQSFGQTMLLLVMLAVALTLLLGVVHHVNLSRVRAEQEASRWQHDINERKKAAAILERRTAQLENLHQAGLAITAEVESGGLLHAITTRALSLFEGTAAALLLPSTTKEVLGLAARAGRDSTFTGKSFAAVVELAADVHRTGSTVVVPVAGPADGSTTPSDGRPWAAAVITPIRSGDRCEGVLAVFSDAPGFMSRDREVLLGLFATHAAIAIRNAALLDQVRRDVTEKATLLQEVNHRVKNNLMRLGEILRLRRELTPPTEPRLQAALRDLGNRLDGMTVLHSLLSSSRWSPLPLEELVTRVVDAALRDPGNPSAMRVTVSVPNGVQVVPEQATALALILNELATNSLKHAATNRATAHMELQVQVEDRAAGRPFVRMEYRDDGPGWPEPVLCGQTKGLGLSLIQATVRSPLRGALTLRNEAGAVAEVTFHLALPA